MNCQDIRSGLIRLGIDPTTAAVGQDEDLEQEQEQEGRFGFDMLVSPCSKQVHSV